MSKCHSNNCKTCSILITDTTFVSSLTNRKYNVSSCENLSCKSGKVVYAIECDLCGLIYVGETKGQLRKRVNGHRLEKIYHHTNSPALSTPYRRKREEHWIRELGTTTPYGCNDNISTIRNLSSPGCSSVNVMNLFNTHQRRNRSHGHHHYTPPRLHHMSYDTLLHNIPKQLGTHYLRTKLYAIPLTKLRVLYESCIQTTHFDSNSPEYKMDAIIMDISNHRLFKPVQETSVEEHPRLFLTMKFANKGLDAVRLSDILNHKCYQQNSSIF